MQDPTEKWTQKNLGDLAYSKKERNISKTLSFVDDMMRLKDKVFHARSLQRTIHNLATSNEPVDNQVYSFFQEERTDFSHTCSWVYISCLVDYPKLISQLKLSKAQESKLMAKISATVKFIEQVRNDPRNDTDMRKIIKKNSDWKWRD